MKGLELSRKFYEEYGKPMLREGFADFEDKIAVGMAGHGSECFGYDDDISADHDFRPEFCLWITDDGDREFGFKLFRAYSKLPKEFMGIKVSENSAFGGNSRGVHTIRDFYSQYLPSGDVPASLDEWLSIPDFYLSEATNGEVFCDPLGEFSRIRNELLKGFPGDVRLYKLSKAVFDMAQAGQYNYSRCMFHGEKAAAGLALYEFVKSCTHAVYLLNNRYMPYYKWMFRGMRELPSLGELEKSLTELMEAPYEQPKNSVLLEKICAEIAAELRAQKLSDKTCDYLEPYSYCIKNRISDNILRNS